MAMNVNWDDYILSKSYSERYLICELSLDYYKKGASKIKKIAKGEQIGKSLLVLQFMLNIIFF